MKYLIAVLVLLFSFAVNAASLAVQFAHPQLTINRTLTVPDDKLVEFADLLIVDYGPDENGDPLVRATAAARFLESMLEAAKDSYRRMKRNEAEAAIVDAEIEAP